MRVCGYTCGNMQHQPSDRWRFVLGMAQMFVATAAAMLLLWTGVNVLTVTATIVATMLTVTSRFLFRRPRT